MGHPKRKLIPTSDFQVLYLLVSGSVYLLYKLPMRRSAYVHNTTFFYYTKINKTSSEQKRSMDCHLAAFLKARQTMLIPELPRCEVIEARWSTIPCHPWCMAQPATNATSPTRILTVLASGIPIYRPSMLLLLMVSVSKSKYTMAF